MLALLRHMPPLFLCAFALAACAGIVGADFDGYTKQAETGDAASADASETAPAAGDGATPPSPDSATTDGSTPPPPPPPPPGTHACTGSAWSCSVFAADHTGCSLESGCSWQTATCTPTTPCSSFKTNMACQAAPGCETDFATSTCVAIGGYCVGSTKPVCESVTGCAYAGGCTGTAKSCGSIADEPSCKNQKGCTWT